MREDRKTYAEEFPEAFMETSSLRRYTTPHFSRVNYDTVTSFFRGQNERGNFAVGSPDTA